MAEEFNFSIIWNTAYNKINEVCMNMWAIYSWINQEFTGNKLSFLFIVGYKTWVDWKIMLMSNDNLGAHTIQIMSNSQYMNQFYVYYLILLMLSILCGLSMQCKWYTGSVTWQSLRTTKYGNISENSTSEDEVGTTMCNGSNQERSLI
jgi:hypothetical protein